MSARSSVVIVGRTNVGKSSLFNRLSSSVKSMIFDYEGVTRDFIKDTICWKDACFDLIDTGGISLKKSQDAITEKTRLIALEMIELAHSIIFVVDGSAGLIQEDRDIAKLLHKLGKPIILVINKIDIKNARDNIYEFERLGFPYIVPVSCTQATGIGDILDTITTLLPAQEKVTPLEEPAAKIVLLGKPNVGKSSLLNTLLNKERSIVSDEPGTTREAISEHLTFYQEDIQITDTPGIRKKKSVKEPLESLMVKSSLHALEHADVVLLLVDASEGQLCDQELKLAFYAFTDLYKAVIIVFNKWDLVDEQKKAQLEYQLQPYDHIMKKVERIDISCKTGKNVGKIMPLVQEVYKRYTSELSDHDLTVICKKGLEQRPLYNKTQLLKLFRVRQVAKRPITLLMIVNQPQWFGASQLSFFENILRTKFKLKGTPIKFIPRTS